MSTLVIVESPTKAKTITKFLGKGFKVESSFGHIRDLPKSKMGVDIENGTFEPNYEVPALKKKHVNKLKELAKDKDVIFATDEDREGEAISWHLAHELKIKPEKAKRIVFHEITKHAIEEALKNPRLIDQNLVDAQQARRILDRLVGYELSPLLWKKVARGLSAGRVQSVCVRLVVEKEREIQKFISEEYWTIEAVFEKAEHNFSGKLHTIDGKNVKKLDLKTKIQIDEILENLKDAKYKVVAITKKETKRTPPPAFTTSTLQQASNQKLGYSSKQTMRLAQQLYEGVEIGKGGAVGLITYMRTDSVNLSEKFLGEAQNYIGEKYGKNYTLEKPRFYKNKSKGAQEAHEAIRPTHADLAPDDIKEYLSSQQFRLYSLIWKRAMATQMPEARLNKTNIDTEAKKYSFRSNGQSMIFDGWLKLYPESIREEMLPELKENDLLNCRELKPEQHFTEPPARYSDATLVKILEEHGIGRPSTYAPTIDTIENRNYVIRDDNKKLKPTDIAFLVTDLLIENFPNIVDYNFTAEMEQDLDHIASGEKKWQPIIKNFYIPFHKQIIEKQKNLDKSETTQIHQLGVDPETGKPVVARIGRFGPFVQLGDKEDEEKPKFAKLKKEQTLDSLTLEDALHLLSLPKKLGVTAEGEEIIVGIGRFGPYVKVGEKYYSAKDVDPYQIDLTKAEEIINLEKEKKAKQTLKEFKEKNITVKTGRYGPYITDGKINVKVPKDTVPENLTLEDCEKLLSEKIQKKK